jgi:hypothetical protein
MSKIRLNTTKKLNVYRMRRQRAAYIERGFVRVLGGAWVKAGSVKNGRQTNRKNARNG